MSSQAASITKFLSHFGKNNVLFTSSGRTRMSKSTDLKNVLHHNEHNKQDAYFVVNPGGAKESDITKLTSVFVDLDAGRDSQGHYYTSNIVRGRKAKMKKAISSFPLKPNFIVETRNGFQVYWLLSSTVKNSVRLNRWNKVQRTIHTYFSKVGADSKVLKCNQILRLPFTKWHKTWEGVAPFDVKLIQSFSRIRHKLVDFQKVVPRPASVVGFESGRKQVASYTRVATVVNGGDGPYRNTTKRSPSANNSTESVIKAIEFLRDVNPFLFRQGNKFMAKSATTLANELGDAFGVS